MDEKENVATSPEATETQTAETQTTEVKHSRNSPDAQAFGNIWNASESRKDALNRFATAGFDMSYSAMVARVKSYRTRGIHLKEIAPADRGRRLDVAAVNAALDAGKATV